MNAASRALWLTLAGVHFTLGLQRPAAAARQAAAHPWRLPGFFDVVFVLESIGVEAV